MSNTKSRTWLSLSEDMIHTLFFRIVSALAIVCLSVPIVVSYFTPIHCDSAITLVEMERITEGFIPYQTLHLNYPPLWFYATSALKNLFDIPYGAYYFYLTIHWIVILASAICVCYIAYRLNANKSVALLTAACFLLVLERLQGNVIYLDQPCLFLGLCGIAGTYLFEKRNVFWFLLVGAITSLSFLTKQFGFGFAPLVLWLILTSDTRTNKKSAAALFLTGYCVPLLLTYSIWGDTFVQATLLNGYGMQKLNETDEGAFTAAPQLISVAKSLLTLFLTITPVATLALLLFSQSFKQRRALDLTFCFLGIFGFSLTFYFSSTNLLYYIYPATFAILLIPILTSLTTNALTRKVIFLFIMTNVALLLFSTYRNRVVKDLTDNKDDYTTQWIIGNKLKSHVRQSSVFIPQSELVYAYYTGDLQSADYPSFGYANGPYEIDSTMAARHTLETDYVLYSEDISRPPFFSDSLLRYVNAFSSDTIAPGIILYDLRQRH